MKNKALYQDAYTGSRTDEYEITINDSKTIIMKNCKYSACDAIAVSLSQFDDNKDIDCTNNGLNNISINRKEHKKTSCIIANLSILLDIGSRVEFKQDDKIVTLKRVFKT